jgi:hypothetical protein
VNLAILKFKYDDPATTEGMLRYTGLHYFGVERHYHKYRPLAGRGASGKE